MRDSPDQAAVKTGGSAGRSSAGFVLSCGNLLFHGQLDAKRRARARRGFHFNFSAVIADHRLHDRKAEAGAVPLGRVIRA